MNLWKITNSLYDNGGKKDLIVDKRKMNTETKFTRWPSFPFLEVNS